MSACQSSRDCSVTSRPPASSSKPFSPIEFICICPSGRDAAANERHGLHRKHTHAHPPVGGIDFPVLQLVAVSGAAFNPLLAVLCLHY